MGSANAYRYVPGLYDANLNGPEPTGVLFFGLVRSGWLPYTCLDRASVKCGENDSGSAMVGVESLMTAVCGSGAWI